MSRSLTIPEMDSRVASPMVKLHRQSVARERMADSAARRCALRHDGYLRFLGNRRSPVGDYQTNVLTFRLFSPVAAIHGLFLLELCDARGNRNAGQGSAATAQNNAGQNGNYWSSTPSSSNAWNMNFNSGNANVNLNTQTYPFSVRLFHEASAPVKEDKAHLSL